MFFGFLDLGSMKAGYWFSCFIRCLLGDRGCGRIFCFGVLLSLLFCMCLVVIDVGMLWCFFEVDCLIRIVIVGLVGCG